MITIDEFMTRDVFTLSPDDTLYNAQTLMVEHNIRHLPVVDDNNKLVGLVTHRDLLAAAESTLSEPDEPAVDHPDRQQPIAEVRKLSHKVSEVMTTKLSVIDPKSSLRGAAMHLQKFRHGCLPVVENDRLVGIITDSDFVIIAMNLIEQLEDVEPLGEDDF